MENKPATTTLSRTATAHHLQVWLFVPDQHLILPGLSKLSKRTSCSQWKTNQQQQHYQGPLLLLLPSYAGLPFLPEQHLILPGLSKLSKKICWCSQWKTNQKQQHYQGPLLPSPSSLAFCARTSTSLPGLSKLYQKRFHVVNGKQTRNNNLTMDLHSRWVFLKDEHLQPQLSE